MFKTSDRAIGNPFQPAKSSPRPVSTSVGGGEHGTGRLSVSAETASLTGAGKKLPNPLGSDTKPEPKGGGERVKNGVLKDGPGHWGKDLKEAMAAAKDRALAKKELEGKFDVVADDFKGQKRPNQVTQAEYEKIVATYSDIRRGKTDLQLNTEGMTEEQKTKFVHDTMGDIGSIMQTSSGRNLIEQLAYQKDDHQTTINLAKDSLGNPNPLGASADAQDPLERSKWSDGTGVNAKLNYVPGQDVTIPGYEKDTFNPIRSDVVLYHEMVHALHIANGSMAKGTVTNGPQVDIDRGIQNFEHQATGLGDYAADPMTENGYRRERNAIGNHTGGIINATTAALDDRSMPQRTNYAPTP